MKRTVLAGGCLFLVGCGMPAKVRQAQDLQRSGHAIEAADLYIEALQELRDPGQRARVEQALDVLRVPIVDSALTKAESLIGPGDTLDEISKSMAALTAFQKYDDKRKRITARLEEYGGRHKRLVSRFDELVAGANQKADGQQWNAANADLDAAFRINPLPAVREQQRTIIQRRDKDYQTRIEAACKEKDWERAAAVLEEFRENRPPPQNELVNSLASSVARTKGLIIRDEVDGLRKNSRYFTAYTTLLKAQIEGADELLRDISKEGCAYYLEVGKQSLSRKDIYAAYLAAVKALTLDSDNNEAFTFHRDCEDAVDRVIHLQIAIAGFGTPAKEPNAGEEFSDTLISHLAHILPYGVDIVERAKIDEALKQRSIGDAVEHLGIHLAIVGNVTTLEVDRTASPRRNSHQVKVGTDSIPNPRYSEFLARYGPNKARWPEQISELIVNDRFQMVEVEQTDVRMEGVMTVSVRLVETGKGGITRSETFNVADKAESSQHGGIPAVGLKDKALDLPTESGMKKNLQTRSVEKVAKWVLEGFEQRQGRYYVEAMKHIERREYPKAIAEAAKGYLYCLRGRVVKDDNWDSDPWASKLRQLALFELTEPSP